MQVQMFAVNIVTDTSCFEIRLFPLQIDVLYNNKNVRVRYNIYAKHFEHVQCTAYATVRELIFTKLVWFGFVRSCFAVLFHVCVTHTLCDSTQHYIHILLLVF